MSASELVFKLINSIDKEYYCTDIHRESLQQLVEVMLDCPEKPEKYNLKFTDYDLAKPGPIRNLSDAICLTSGGADSTIFWYKENKPQGLYIDIGQKYCKKEIRCLEKCDVDYELVNLKGAVYPVYWKHIIPGRNLLFLTLAADRVKDGGKIFFSVVEGEGADSGKGDKSNLFLFRFQDWYKAVTGKQVYVLTMAERTKAGWLRWFRDNGYNLAIIRYQTVTCFSEEKGQCGRCQACLRKFLSFASISMDITKDFNVNPYDGARQYVEKYKTVMREALDKRDFSHYSEKRCLEDLRAIEDIENGKVELC